MARSSEVVVFAIVGWRRDNPNAVAESVADVGVGAAAASCDDVITEKASGVNAHVGPGTTQPDKTTVEYASSPPSFGEHFASA